MSERRSNTMVLLSRESLSIAIAAAGMLAQTSFGSGEFQYGTISEAGTVCATARAESPFQGQFDEEITCVPISNGSGFAVATASRQDVGGPCTVTNRSHATLTTAYVLTTDPGQLGIGGESLAVHTVRASSTGDGCHVPAVCFLGKAVADAESDLLIDVNFTLEQDTRIKVTICGLSRNVDEGSSTFEWRLFDEGGNEIAACLLQVNGIGEDAGPVFVFDAPMGDYLWQVSYHTQGLRVTASVVECPQSDSDSLIGGDAWAATLTIVKFGQVP